MYNSNSVVQKGDCIFARVHCKCCCIQWHILVTVLNNISFRFIPQICPNYLLLFFPLEITIEQSHSVDRQAFKFVKRLFLRCSLVSDQVFPKIFFHFFGCSILRLPLLQKSYGICRVLTTCAVNVNVSVIISVLNTLPQRSVKTNMTNKLRLKFRSSRVYHSTRYTRTLEER